MLQEDIGQTTKAESLTPYFVDTTLIMLSLPLDMDLMVVKSISLWETLGTRHGERKVTLESLLSMMVILMQVFVEFFWTLQDQQLIDQIGKCNLIKILLSTEIYLKLIKNKLI